MTNSSRLRCLPAILFFASAVAVAAELPENFPGDVPIADYMEVTNVTIVRDNMMLSLHAPNKSIEDVVEWFRAGLGDNGWNSEGDHVTARNAILAYTKNGRRCGVSVTNFVMDERMQMDDSIKGVTLQLSGATKSEQGTAEYASEAADQSATEE